MSKLSFAALACIAALAVPAFSVPRGTTASAEPRWTESDGAAFLASVDALEERLLADRARVRFWEEMRERHGGVTAVACTNLGEHAMAMARAAERNQAKMSDQKRRRVAMAVDTH